MSLQNFIAEVKAGGLARTNRYKVYFDPPFNKGIQKTLLYCDQIQLPSVNLSTIQNRTFGEFREVPYEKLFGDISISFYVDKDMEVKYLFDEWMGYIQDPINRTFNYYNNYTSDMSIEVQDLMDNSTYIVVLYECYPKTIGAVQLDYASKDIMKLSVTMQYKYFRTSVIETERKEETDFFTQAEEKEAASLYNEKLDIYRGRVR
jgi:hypothetical protein